MLGFARYAVDFGRIDHDYPSTDRGACSSKTRHWVPLPVPRQVLVFVRKRGRQGASNRGAYNWFAGGQVVIGSQNDYWS